MGISPETRCDDAVDAKLHKALRQAGCRGILRATYLDALQGVVLTVGVAAFADEVGRGAGQGVAAPGGPPLAGPADAGLPRHGHRPLHLGRAAEQPRYGRPGRTW